MVLHNFFSDSLKPAQGGAGGIASAMEGWSPGWGQLCSLQSQSGILKPCWSEGAAPGWAHSTNLGKDGLGGDSWIPAAWPLLSRNPSHFCTHLGRFVCWNISGSVPKVTFQCFGGFILPIPSQPSVSPCCGHGKNLSASSWLWCFLVHLEFAQNDAEFNKTWLWWGARAVTAGGGEERESLGRSWGGSWGISALKLWNLRQNQQLLVLCGVCPLF